MHDPNEFVSRLFEGDEAGATAALNALTAPAAVAREVRRQMETERALDEFVSANRDIAGDRQLAAVADAHLAREIGGRDFNTLAPAEARAALAQAGESTRRWLRSVAPREAPQSAGESDPSSVIEKMKRARGQA